LSTVFLLLRRGLADYSTTANMSLLSV